MFKSFIFYIFIVLAGAFLCSCGAKKRTLKATTEEIKTVQTVDSSQTSEKTEEKAEEKAEEVIFEITETETDTTTSGETPIIRTKTIKKTIKRGETQKTTLQTTEGAKTATTNEKTGKTATSTEKTRERGQNPCFFLHALAGLLALVLFLLFVFGKRKNRL